MRLRHLIVAAAAVAVVGSAAGCGDENGADTGSPSSGGSDELVVAGTQRVAEDLPMLTWADVQFDASTTSVVPDVHVDGMVTLLWVTGDPLAVFDRLVAQLGFDPRVTASRVCVVRGAQVDRVLTEPASPGNEGLRCVVEAAPGRVEVTSPVGRICLDSRRESPECPMVGLARIERPVERPGSPPDSGLLVLHSEQRWREILGRADAEFTPLDLPDDLLTEIHRPSGGTDHVPVWPSPGDMLDESSESGPDIPDGVDVLTPVVGLGDAGYGVVVSSSRPAADVIAEYMGGRGSLEEVDDGDATYVSANDMSACARGVEHRDSSTVLLMWICPT